MKTHIDFQVIEQNGKPAFAVVPYSEFITLVRPKGTIPHAVVEANLIGDISLPRAWREHLGLTQKEVAKKAGMTQAALSQLEKTKARPRKATLEKLARALDLTVEQLRE